VLMGGYSPWRGGGVKGGPTSGSREGTTAISVGEGRDP
jgi:hypothetical protein